MEMAQGLSRKSVFPDTNAVANGVAGWVVGALQGRVRIKWRGTAASVRVRSQMELVETLSLGGKRQVMLIECQGERYLVGCGPDAVATIEKLAPESRPAAPATVSSTHNATRSVAQAWL